MFRPALLAALLCALGVPEHARAQETAASRRASIEMMYPVMVKALDAGRFGQARNICDQAILWEPENPVHPYNLACIEARAGTARFPHAFSALQLAVDLGFNDRKLLDTDADLEPLRADPRFSLIAERVAENARNPATGRTLETESLEADLRALAGSPTAPPLVQPGLARPIDLAALVTVEPPEEASFLSGTPVGLYVMTRSLARSAVVEKLVWYFARDGAVYQSIEYGFGPADLAAHRGPIGRCRLEGNTLEITWSDRKKSKGTLQRTAQGFVWDRGTFVAARPFGPGASLNGAYEGGEPFALPANHAPLSRVLELRKDGTFYWGGVSFLRRSGHPTGVYAATAGRDTAGRWRADGYCLVLVDSEGRIYRRIAFPAVDTSPTMPERIIFGGTLYSRQ